MTHLAFEFFKFHLKPDRVIEYRGFREGFWAMQRERLSDSSGVAVERPADAGLSTENFYTFGQNSKSHSIFTPGSSLDLKMK